MVIESSGSGNLAEVDGGIFEFCLPQWARDPMKGCESPLQQQGLKMMRPTSRS